MNKKAILVSLISLAALGAAAAVYFTNKIDAPVNEEAAVEGTAANFFRPVAGELESAESKIDCRKPEASKRAVGDELNRFWQNTEDDTVQTFIHFDKSSRVMTVCHKGERTSALLPVDDDVANVEIVRVSEAQFGDMNGDGKNDFLVFQGQCAEGPCLGAYTIMQIDGGKIKKLYDLFAETVELVNESGQNGLRMEKYCFTHQFSLGPIYFSVAAFAKDGQLTTVPYPELRTKFPEATAKIKPSQDLEIGEELPPAQAAYLKVHDLIVQAYQGKPRKDLLKSYDKIVGAMLPVEGETSPDDRLGLYCNVREILELIAIP